MWWLAIPVIGAIVAAVASSDDEDKKKAELEAQARQRRGEAEAKARAIAQARQAEVKKRKTRVAAETVEQLEELFLAHAAVLECQSAAPLKPGFETLKAFAGKNVPSRPGTLLKHLEFVVPGTAFSSAWTAQERKIKALQCEIAEFKKLKEELLG